MSITSHIKCPNCGVFNTNKEYCENCNTLISDKKKRALKAAKIEKDDIAEEIIKQQKISFAKKMQLHPFFLFKIFGWVLQSVWFVLNIIGALIAWLVAMVAMG